jgi:hypothetical protein
MRCQEFACEIPYLLQIQLGSRMRIHHGGMVDVFAVLRDKSPYGEFLHVDIGTDERRELWRQVADGGGLYAIVVNKAGNFGGTITRQ